MKITSNVDSIDENRDVTIFRLFEKLVKRDRVNSAFLGMFMNVYSIILGVLFPAVFLLFSSTVSAQECVGFGANCGWLSYDQCLIQRGCGWVSGAGLSHCAGLAHPCKSFTDEASCNSQQGCFWDVPPPPPENHGCSQRDFDICRTQGASCFLSTNNGSHPHSNLEPPRGYKKNDQVALCWWKLKREMTCPNTPSGGFWSTASNFGNKFGWSSPPLVGWGQCMSQCANFGGGFDGRSRCTNP